MPMLFTPLQSWRRQTPFSVRVSPVRTTFRRAPPESGADAQGARDDRRFWDTDTLTHWGDIVSKPLMIDNHDSFACNLVRYFGEPGQEVSRNDAIPNRF
jgi:hypothetical protein